MKDLKPCPFCGGPVDIEKTIDGRKWWGVVCRNTLGLGGTCAIEQRASASEEAAITRWNTRHTDTALQQAIDAITAHHQWHAAQIDPDPVHGYIPADEYADSGLYEKTVHALHAIGMTLHPQRNFEGADHE